MNSNKRFKVYVQGSDNVGWSVDQDRENLINVIKKNNLIEYTNSYFKADIIHNIWWNTAFNKINSFFRLFTNKKILLTASNFIDLNDPNYESTELFKKAQEFTDAWIAPSKKQNIIFKNNKIATYYLPFLVSDKHFHVIKREKKEIINELGLNYNFFKNKIIISSFQRDTLSDLKTPKWQKNPDGLIEILKQLPKKSYIFLICGPRRHYLKKKCVDNKIPFIFHGVETKNDDLHINNLDKTIINKLYNISDIYIVSSKSEGGPKAIIESILTETMIFSTDVGIARDFIDDKCIIENDFKNLDYLKSLINKNQLIKSKNKILKVNLNKYKRIYNNYENFLINIYKDILNEV